MSNNERKSLKLDSGYRGEIRLGDPGYKKVTNYGVTKHIHTVDSDTWKNMREQMGIVEDAVKANSMYEVIGRARKVPLSHLPDYIIKSEGKNE